jgi:alpha-galactosidase
VPAFRLATVFCTFGAVALAAACGGDGAKSGVTDAAGAADASLPESAPGDDAGGPTGGDSGPRLDAYSEATSAPDGAVDAADADAWPGSVIGCVSGSGVVTLIDGNVEVDYDLTAGTATFLFAGTPKIVRFYAGVQLASYVTSTQYATHACTTAGNRVTITSSGNGLPTMQQTFVAPGGNHFFAQVTVAGSALSTNWIGPVVVDGTGTVDVGSNGDGRVLQVPFDNDNFSTYGALPLGTTGNGFEVAAFYDNTSRNGIVTGSVTHDTWKTGIYFAGSNGRLGALNVYGGANSAAGTHDVVPHGKVTGNTVSSPVVFVGYGPDWRDLLEEYADANAALSPMRGWPGGVPFGWSSWGKIQTAITYDKAVAVSDFIQAKLQTSFDNAGTVYVNLDSYWDNLTDGQLAQFVAHCHANGQKAGIYWTPFVDWGESATRPVEGSSTYTYQQIWLRDASGNPIAMDGAYAVDPTHPGTKSRIDYFVDRFKALGFEYVKLDFLTHGALESTARYDTAVETGIQAYNQGMQYLVDRVAGTMFLSESIAPLFPYGYAHARRVSCDTFGAAVGLESSEYELNSATYGWWMSGRLYRYNDPDEMVFEGFASADNMTRLVSAVVSGTVFVDGDDLTDTGGQALAATYLTNPRINAVAALGKPFRPVEGNTGTDAADVLVLADGATTYLAVFNFTTSDVTRAIDLARAGLNPTQTYTVTDLWSGATSTSTGTMSVDLAGHYAKLLRLT